MAHRTDNHSPVIGVDIGGTKVAAGLVDREGNILSQVRHPMIANGDAEAGLQAVSAAIGSLTRGSPGALTTNLTVQNAVHNVLQSEVEGIGICAPGPLDPYTGVVVNPPNLPCWRNFPLGRRMSEIYRVPVKVDNDANAAALAETRWGAARGYRYVFYATLGTGIGTGIVFDGRIYHGHTGAAGEGGHMSIDYHGPRCACGKLGCIEASAAGPAIAARARAKLSDSSASTAGHSTILGLVQGDVEAVTSEIVGKAYAAGDLLAGEILQETAELLTIWLGNIIDLLDPDVIVMGGGVAAMLAPFFAAIKQRLPQWCVNPRSAEIPLLLAHYKGDAGIAGGAALCSENS